MAVPKRKQSHSRTHKRRSHEAVVPIQLHACKQCGYMIPSHRCCPNCGFYRGRLIIAPKGKAPAAGGAPSAGDSPAAPEGDA